MPDQQEMTPIKVTPDMIEAGVAALSEFEDGDGYSLGRVDKRLQP